MLGGGAGAGLAAARRGRSGSAGRSKAWLAHLRRLRDKAGLDVSFSVGFTMTEQVQQAILALPELIWARPPRPTDRRARARRWPSRRFMLPDPTAGGWPERMRVIVRRERPTQAPELAALIAGAASRAGALWPRTALSA